MSIPDLAPAAPSRIVLIDAYPLGEHAPGTGTVTFTLLTDLRVLSTGQIIQASTVNVKLMDGKGQVRLPTRSTAVTDDCGDDWVIIVRKSWTTPYAIQVPAGTSDLNLGDIAPARPLTRREHLWAITAASVSVENLPSTGVASGTVALSGGALDFRLRIPKGEQGLPGPGAVAADTAVAAYVQSESLTSDALNKVYRRGYAPAEWGVVGDGVVDDGPAWRNLLAAAPDGATIVCPEGDVYRITGTLPVTRPITVQGGKWVHVTQTGNLWDVTASNVALTDQVWEGANQSLDLTHRGAYIHGTTAAPLVGTRLERIDSTGFRGEVVRMLSCNDTTIDRFVCRDYWYAGLMILSCVGGRITRSWTKNALQSTEIRDAYGIAISDSTNTMAGRSRDWVIDNNRVEGVRFHEGIDTHSGDNITITNNTVIDCCTGIAVLPGNASRTVAPTNCIVSGNTVIRGDASDERYGIQFFGVNGGMDATGTVMNNVVMGYTRDLNWWYVNTARTTVMGMTTDASVRMAPPSPQWREWNAVTNINATGGDGKKTVTFPSGMFSQPPLVQATKQTGTNAPYIPWVGAITAESCDVGVYKPGGTADPSLFIPVAIRVSQASMNSAGGTA